MIKREEEKVVVLPMLSRGEGFERPMRNADVSTSPFCYTVHICRVEGCSCWRHPLRRDLPLPEEYHMHADALQVFLLWRGIVNDLLYWLSHMADQLSSAMFSRIDDVFS